MPGTEITYKTRADESFGGYLAAPDGDGKVPGILLITAIFGIDDENICGIFLGDLGGPGYC